MDKLTIEVDDLTKVSDGYHTIEELYDHRNLLFINLCLSNQDKSYWKHGDVDGWFILYYDIDSGQQISYHIPNKYIKLIDKKIIKIKDNTEVWDGHTSKDVLDRLNRNASMEMKIPEMINCCKCKYYKEIIRPGFGECTNVDVPREKVREFETCSKTEKK